MNSKSAAQEEVENLLKKEKAKTNELETQLSQVLEECRRNEKLRAKLQAEVLRITKERDTQEAL